MVRSNSTYSDVLIVGGGVIGLSIARELRKRGADKIKVVDKGRIGAEASWAAAGMLAANAECHADDELFRLCTASNALYPQFAAELQDETGIDIQLDRTGTLTIGFSVEEAAAIQAKYEWQRSAGIKVELFRPADVIKLEPNISPSVVCGCLYSCDGQVENRKLVTALRRYCEINEIELFENTPIVKLILEDGVFTGAASEKITFKADRVIVTAGAWSSNILPAPVVKPVRGQMISLSGGDPSILRHVVYSPRGYLVPRADGRILVGATVEQAGFRKEVKPEAISLLKSAAVEIVPMLSGSGISEAWAGLRPFVEGEMPVIGRVPEIENAYVATGHYRNGILLAPITARMIADEVLGTHMTNLGVSAFAGPGKN